MKTWSYKMDKSGLDVQIVKGNFAEELVIGFL